MDMKKFLQRYFPAIPVLLLLGPMFFSHSCANTTQAPTGGKKDTLAPLIVKVAPASGITGVRRTGQQFVFTFDEYVKIKNLQNIYLSPPLRRPLKAKTRGKSVIVYFEDDTLAANTTYTIDFTDAIADNNEGNVYPGFTYVFSTGETIDTMMITGIVQDCNTLKPVKGAKVMLYKNQADSALFLEAPVAAAITDDWGYFSIRNIQDTVYRLYAITDGNNDNRYDPESETVAFVDSLIRPVMVVDDSLPELIKYDMKDTINCQKRKTEYELNLFKEKNAKQMIVNKVRLNDRTSYITFMAPNAHIDTMWIRGVPADRLITQFNLQRDCLEVWVNDRRAMPDTFFAMVNYLKTDTLGQLSPFTEEVKLVHPIPKAKRRAARREIKHEDTICAYTLTAKGETVEQEGFQLTFKVPIIYEGFKEMSLRIVNPKQQEEPGTFTVTPDSVNILKYKIMPNVKLMPGFEYFLKMPYHTFRDINGFYNDSTEVKVSLPNDEKLSTLTLHLSGVDGKYIVDLLDEKKTSVVRNRIVNRNGDLVFSYLSAAKYCLRITEDKNDNNLVDTGDLLSHKQPEQAKFYKLKDDSPYIEVLERSEMEQSVDLRDLFKL